MLASFGASGRHGAADRRRIAIVDVPTHLLEKERGLRWVLVDGMLAGSWRIERTKASARLVVHSFGAWTHAQEREATDEGGALLAFAASDADHHDVEIVAA